MSKENNFQTPMMQQYASIKKQYPDCLLFFRLGDFYELFLEDAKVGARVLDITLTARSKGKDGKIPMCGVPYHSVDSYMAKVIKAGYKAAICEQVSDPKRGMDIVEREVVRIITPGTVVDEKMLERSSNNYLLTAKVGKESYAIAYADLSTGEFFVSKGNHNSGDSMNDLIRHINKINPGEVVLPDDYYKDTEFLSKVKEAVNANIFASKEYELDFSESAEFIRKFFNVKTLEVFDIDESDELLLHAASNLIKYLQYTQKDRLFHIKQISNITEKNFMRIDAELIQNLEIFESNRTDRGKKSGMSFIDVVDKTLTPMGARLIRQWILYPLLEKERIDDRLNRVEEFAKDHQLRDLTRDYLKKIYDVERILSRLGTGNCNARDLISLKESLYNTLNIINNYSGLKLSAEVIDSGRKVIEKIDETIAEDPPISIKEGKLIKSGINDELDKIKSSISSSREWLNMLEKEEKEKTGINTLKVGYNSVFGYFIEVSKANTGLVPANYVRKQTLTNAERYITEELKEHENIVLSAEEKINLLEYEIFLKIVGDILKHVLDVQQIAKYAAKIDCFSSLSVLAIEANYTRPKIYKKENYKSDFLECRHPVVESVLESGEFTPNSISISKNNFLHLITGPNMSGKSTYIRQVALIQILAQIGSFVPCYKADVSIVDAIFTRIGAGDALAQGLSTFMVEMIETAKILNNATEHSLIILDEVGRGTSTIDGLSIAQAVVEHIHNKIKAKTLFATHFHELTMLEQRLKKLDNYHIKIIEKDGDIKFLHKVEKGGTDKSYGVEVAKLAGIPQEVVVRAKEILSKNSSSQLKLAI